MKKTQKKSKGQGKYTTQAKEQKAPVASIKTVDEAIELFKINKFSEAKIIFSELLNLNSQDVLCLYHLSAIYFHEKELDQALAYVSLAVKFLPNKSGSLWLLHAMVLQNQGRYEDALQSFKNAIAIEPENVSLLINYGVLLRHMLLHHEALAQFKKALSLEPGNVLALGNVGMLLSEVKQSAEAISAFERLVELAPDYKYALGSLCYERLRSCDWTDFESLESRILDAIRAKKSPCRPFALMALLSTAQDQQLAAMIFAEERFPKSKVTLAPLNGYQHERIRIGYISADFREHPVGHLMVGVIEAHDRTKFEIYAFSKGANDNSPLRTRFESAFDHFIDVSQKGPRLIADLIREHEIDIAIDLGGYTQDSGIESFTFRPAPVQATFLGYPGTLGASYFDYILADGHVIPEQNRRYFNEKMLSLPDCYLPVATSVKISERTPSREECGLPPAGAVLCCFSHDFKIHPAIFKVWMNLLRRLPETVLWLSCRGDSSQVNLRRSAEQQGIDPNRLVFADRVPLIEDHLARYRVADVFIDTVPYNAHTTAADALWAGLPVVTCMGDAFPARVAGSLLHAAGMPELIAASLADYESLVVELVSNPGLLAATKAKLQRNQLTHPVFSPAKYCEGLEQAFLTMQSAAGFARPTGTEALGIDAVASAANATRSDRADEALLLTLHSGPVPDVAAAAEVLSFQSGRRLHIGGKVRSPGWEVLNALPGSCVDHLGNANNLAMFPDQSFEIVYASHVVEHFDYRDELSHTLKEWLRVLKPGGVVQISVPDLAVLAGMILNKQFQTLDRFKVMMMIFGGHVDAYDHHKVGLTDDILTTFLLNAGFVDVRRVDRFGYFQDTSDMVFAGQRISLNIQGKRPV